MTDELLAPAAAPAASVQGWIDVLISVVEALQQSPSVEVAIGHIVQAGRRLGFARARLWLVKESGQVLEGAGHSGDTDLEGFVGFRMPITNSPYTQRVIGLRRPCKFVGQELTPWSLPHSLSARFAPPTGEWMHLPLWAGDRCWGVLTLDNADSPHPIDRPQLDVLHLFSRQIATALAHLHLAAQEEQQRDMRRWLQRIAEIAEHAQRALSVEDVADVIVQGGRDLGFERVRLWLVSADEQRILGARQSGNVGLDRFTGCAMPLDASPYVTHTLASPTPVIFDGLEHGPSHLHRRFQAAGYAAPRGHWAGVPLRVEPGQCIGLLMLDNISTPRPLTTTHSDMLALLGRQASAALERARQSYERRWLYALTQIEQETQRLRTVRETAELIVREGGRLRFKRVRLWEYEPEGNILVGLSQHGEALGQPFTSIWVPLVASSYGQAEPLTREPIFFSGRSAEHAHLDYCFEEQGIAAPAGEWASIPLWAGDRFLGLLELDYAGQTRSLYAGQRDLLRLLGSQAAAALERAHAIEDERDREHELRALRHAHQHQQRELISLTNLVDGARRVQQALTVQDVAQAIIAAGRSLGFGRVRLWALDASQQAIRCIGQSGGDEAMVGATIPLAESVYARRLMEHHEPELLRWRDLHPAYIDRYADALRFELPVDQWIGAPLWSGERGPIGLLVLDNGREPLTLSDEQHELIRIFSRHAETALERARLYEEERRQRFERDWLARLAEVAMAAQDAQTQKQVIAQLIGGGQTLGFDHVQLWRLAESGAELECVGERGHGQQPPGRGARRPLAALGAVRQAIETCAVVVDEGDDAGAAVTIPLFSARSRAWGALTLRRPRDARLVQPEQRSLLELFQRLASSGIDRAESQQQRAAMLEQPQLMGHLLARGVRHMDEGQLLARIVAAARDALHAHSAAYFPFDRRARRFSEPIVSGDLARRAIALRSPNEDGHPVRRIGEHLRAEYLPRVRLAPPPARGQARGPHASASAGALAGVPLAIRDELLGVLCLVYDAPREFDIAEKAFIQLFAHNASLLHVSARLARDQERRRLASNLHDTLQNSLFALRTHCREAIRVLRTDPERALQLLHEVQRAGWGVETDVRVVLHEMTGDESAQLEELIQRRIKHVLVGGVRLRLSIDRRLPPLPLLLVRAILYILAEASVNAVEHGRARSLTVQLRPSSGRLRLKIADDGAGFPREQTVAPSHYGLRNMRARVRQLGGSLRIRTAPGAGTRLFFDLPLRRGQPGLMSLRARRCPRCAGRARACSGCLLGRPDQNRRRS